MAEFLDTQGVSYYLKKLINNSNDKLYLISPFLQLNNQLKLSLEDRHKFSIDIIIIYGKLSDINPDDSKWLQSMPGIKLLFHKDLHAKCYFNEKETIITSMNLFMFSQQNNVEMGIYISKEKDEELYTKIADEVDRIKRGSEHRTISVQKVEYKKPEQPKEKSEPQKVNKRSGEKPKFEKGKDYSKSRYKSTSALSEIMGIQSKKLFEIFMKKNWIVKDGKSWILTKKGEQNGGQMKNGQYGEYVAWPEEVVEEIDDSI